MADWSMYHALGQGEEDQNNPQYRTEPAAPQFVPPVAPPPQGYSQGGALPPPGHAVPPPGFQPAQSFQSPPQPIVQGDGSLGGLTTQMGNMGIKGDMTGSVRAHKKRHRLAHHDLVPAAGSSQVFSGMPQGQVQSPSQYLDTGVNQGSQMGAQRANLAPMMTGPQPSLGGGDRSVATQGTVDPSEIPGIPSARDIPAQYYRSNVYPTMERFRPPPAVIPFKAHDQGNSSPKFARLTLNHIPSTADLLSSTSLPLGMILQPLAPLDPGEQTIPVLDFGDSGPPRCRRCRTYINPFMVFKSGGNKVICNMCTFPNDVSPEYFAPLDPSGVRVDRLQRPELMLGTVEYMVPKEYWNKEPVGIRWLFVLDVSQEAVTRGFLEACCEGIMGALYGGDENVEDESDESQSRRLPSGAKVGIVTFDKEIHFYNLSVSHCVAFSTGIAGAHIWYVNRLLYNKLK